MFKILVCIKQVPMVSELPWDSKTGTLKRELAQGMMDPSSRRALEAGLQIKETRAELGEKTQIIVLSMGPPMAMEILYQAKSLGADKGILLSDRAMAGADTFLTSFILARFIKKEVPDVDLVLCGSQTSDSETGQVGPQLAEELSIPAIGYAADIQLQGQMVRVHRHVDDFFEVLEMDLPGLVTIDQAAYTPRYAAFGGVQDAFETADIIQVDARRLGLDENFNAVKDSPTRIVDVYSPTTRKENRVLKGTAKAVVDQLFEDYGKIISSAMGKDLKGQGEKI
ncbi:MAG: electron transfer flavoprotein subunit beta/FixA family protein [Proteobacteria bacterium]|nr:electron transfer flavoprotein subunit beta/FixA family protein [Desulfobacula sp.]MBU4130163.1 electron transfer flavoprotein subunit beta/FixA family protein [Pseudomonadota bacterium]